MVSPETPPDEDDGSSTARVSLQSSSKVPPTISTTPVAVAMIVAGLTIWLVAIAWPGWSLPGLLLGSAMVAAESFELLR